MISPRQFYDAFRSAGVEFFAGVPDSLLKDFCAYVADHAPDKAHVIAANEGSAVALATGYHLATGGVPLVYLQNSGLGNLTNPVLSLADEDVYGIPMVLLIGWRGEPGVPDEPQHIKQGEVTLGLLDCMGIPYSVFDAAERAPDSLVAQAVSAAVDCGSPFALVARKGSFAPYNAAARRETVFGWTREAVIGHIANAVAPEDIVVVTTGMASREMFEYRRARGGGHEQDFLVVGGMGHASQIALGIALQKPDRKVMPTNTTAENFIQSINVTSAMVIDISVSCSNKYMIWSASTKARKSEIPTMTKLSSMNWKIRSMRWLPNTFLIPTSLARLIALAVVKLIKFMAPITARKNAMV